MAGEWVNDGGCINAEAHVKRITRVANVEFILNFSVIRQNNGFCLLIESLMVKIDRAVNSEQKRAE